MAPSTFASAAASSGQNSTAPRDGGSEWCVDMNTSAHGNLLHAAPWQWPLAHIQPQRAVALIFDTIGRADQMALPRPSAEPRMSTPCPLPTRIPRILPSPPPHNPHVTSRRIAMALYRIRAIPKDNYWTFSVCSRVPMEDCLTT